MERMSRAILNIYVACSTYVFDLPSSSQRETFVRDKGQSRWDSLQQKILR